MRIELNAESLVIVLESSEEQATFTNSFKSWNGNVFVLSSQDSQAIRFSNLGPKEEACREPINVTSRSPDPVIQLISNFANTRFTLDDKSYQSVEAFWQGLKFPEEKQRRKISRLYGKEAMEAGAHASVSTTFEYQGNTYRVGTIDHWELMEAACRAKFMQHEDSRFALLSTGKRPLTHITNKDSRNIPGVIMAEIWMKIRRELGG